MMRYNIAYATDDNYVQHVAVSLVSLFSNNVNVRFEVYILSNAVSEVNMAHLKDIEKEYEQTIYFIPVEQLLSKLSENNVSVNKLSISTYSRLYLSTLIPDNVNELLYLDCDTIIVGEIKGIWDFNLSDIFVAGVIDTMFPYYKKAIGLPNEKFYINAGVLFINLAKWRISSIENAFMEFINRYDGKVPHLDQGIINGVFHDKGILDLKYNVQTPIFLFKKFNKMLNYFSLSNYYSESMFESAQKNPLIIHYSAFYADRPWFKFCLHPKKYLYYKYLELTPYKHCPLSKNVRSTLKNKVKSIFFVYCQNIYLKLR